MPLGYRTVLTARGTSENRDRIVEILRDWAIKKQGFPSLPAEGAVTNRKGAHLSSMFFRNETSAGYRWELTENWDVPKRQTVMSSTRRAVVQITLVFSEDRIWLWVDLDAPTLTVLGRDGKSRQEIHEPKVPKFISMVLDEVEMFDGKAAPLSGFQVIPTAAGVVELKEVLEDSARLGAVFVTSPPFGVSVDVWRAKSDRRSYALQGLGVGYVLTSEALSAFNAGVSYGHTVPAGGMRTFLPGARLNDSDDEIHHKLMHPATLRDSDEQRVERILRKAQVERLRNTRLPDAMRDADYEFIRQRRLQPFVSLTPQTAVSSATELAKQNDDLRKRLEIAEEMALEALDDIARLERALTEASANEEAERYEAEVNYLQYSEARRDLERSERQIEYLKRQLRELGSNPEVQSAGADADESEYPETFEQLVEWIDNVPGVRFTGDRAAVVELDEHTALGTAVLTKAWDAILTFSAYCRARDESVFDHSLSNYVTYPTHGCLVRMGKTVWTEGQTVKDSKKLSRQRTFPVDPTVDPSGEMLMVAHLKLSNLTGVAPRLYFADTYSDVGYVTVGYLGAHLENTQTN